MEAIVTKDFRVDGMQIKVGEVYEVHNVGTSCEIILVNDRFFCYTDSDCFRENFTIGEDGNK